MNRDQFKFWNAVGIIIIGLLFYSPPDTPIDTIGGDGAY